MVRIERFELSVSRTRTVRVTKLHYILFCLTMHICLQTQFACNFMIIFGSKNIIFATRHPVCFTDGIMHFDFHKMVDLIGLEPILVAL